MSLQQKVQLELEDGTEITVTYDGRDLRAWESRYKKSALVEPMSLSMLTFLGWSAGKRTEQLNGQFDRYEAFDAACTSVQGVRDEEEDERALDPPKPRARTRKTPSGG
jgi:hypothetical protein